MNSKQLSIAAGAAIVFVMSWYASSLALVLQKRGFSEDEIGIIIGVTPICLMVGALAAGVLLHKFGTKTVGLTLLPFYLGVNLGYLWATSYEWLIVVRLGHGLVNDALMVVISTYLRETTPEGKQKRLMGWFSTVTYGSASTAAMIGTALVTSSQKWMWGSAGTGLIATLCLALFFFSHSSVRRAKEAKEGGQSNILHLVISTVVISVVACCQMAVFTYLPQLPINNGEKIGGLSVSIQYFACGVSGFLLVRVSDRLGDLRTVGYGLFLIMIGNVLIPTRQTPLILIAGLVFGIAIGIAIICLKQVAFRASGQRPIGVSIPVVMIGLGQGFGAIGFSRLNSQWGFDAIWYITLPILMISIISLFVLHARAHN
ncbi:Predicted arabinose efflux permease, MFS family [Seinonella peptonophila]|uniref:Predicted arabinose efflux permease, MFS family n=1 Tax=Seinonella peptonophila TaxID=112248 RepID=A0A1M4X5H1_9BACL|nr:MFS transporter [Seinonella peptonophila]SHE88677.1 Predicted arabinose efflux permease, MFS family [Seinonella peptonophila]